MTRSHPADAADSAATPLIEARELSAAFSAACARSTACRSRLQRGELLGLIGPNGAGKTTLFNLLAGSLEADVGHPIDGRRT